MSGPVCGSPAPVCHPYTYTHTHTHARTHAHLHIHSVITLHIWGLSVAYLDMYSICVCHQNHKTQIYRQEYVFHCLCVTQELSGFLSQQQHMVGHPWWGVSFEEWFSAVLPQPPLRHLPQESHSTHTDTHIDAERCIHMMDTYSQSSLAPPHASAPTAWWDPVLLFPQHIACQLWADHELKYSVMDSWIFTSHVILWRGNTVHH